MGRGCWGFATLPNFEAGGECICEAVMLLDIDAKGLEVLVGVAPGSGEVEIGAE